jgi:hypothetical protein
MESTTERTSGGEQLRFSEFENIGTFADGAQMHIANCCILVPGEHRIDGFLQFRATAFVDTARSSSSELRVQKRSQQLGTSFLLPSSDYFRCFFLSIPS